MGPNGQQPGQQPEPRTIDELVRGMLGSELLEQLNQARLPFDEVRVQRSNGEGLVIRLTPRTARKLRTCLVTVGLAVAGCAGFKLAIEPSQQIGRSHVQEEQSQAPVAACESWR